jgi:hypothetical protein
LPFGPVKDKKESKEYIENQRKAKFAFTRSESETLPSDFLDLVKKTLVFDSGTRLALPDFLTHKFFTAHKPYWDVIE